MATFADRLRSLRAEKNMKQSDLAAVLATVPSAISYWESGQGAPHLDVVQRLADYFGVSMDYMLGRSDYRKVEVPSEHLIDSLNIMMRGDIKKLPPAAQQEIVEYVKLLELKYGKK